MKVKLIVFGLIMIIGLLIILGCDEKNGTEPEPIASLCVSPTTLIINEVKETGIFEVWNCGESGSTLNYTITESCDWLFIDPTSGTSTGEHDDIILTVNFSSFSCGETRNCTIYVSGTGDTKTVTVTVIAKPCDASLCVSLTSLIIIEPTTTGTFGVWNCGESGSTLNYTITEGCNWLSVNPTNGNSTGEHDNITVTIDFSSFASGETKTCIITVSGAGDTKTVTVIATPEPEAALCVSPTSLTIDEPTTTGTFEVWNCGDPGSTLDYTITDTENFNWLSVNPTSGNSTGEHDDITVTIDFSYFDPGETKTCVLTVSGAGNTETVTITATAESEESLCVSTTSLTIDEPTTTGTFEVWNCGDPGSILSYSITESCNWLSVDPSSGTSTGEHDDITVTIDFSYFDPGETKTCVITVSGAGDTEIVTIVATAEIELNIDITSPEYEDAWQMHRSYSIQWESDIYIGNVFIELWQDNEYVLTINSSTSNDGEYAWSPSGCLTNDYSKIRIGNVNNPDDDDKSSKFAIFEITHIYFYGCVCNNYNSTTKMHKCQGSWNENSLTWNNSPPWQSSILATSSTIWMGGRTWHKYNMGSSSLVRDWFDGIDNYGILIDVPNNGDHTRYWSINADDPETEPHPYLEIWYEVDEVNFYIEIEPSEDSWINSDNPNQTYGNSQYLRAYKSSGANNCKIFIKWGDLSDEFPY